MKFFHRVLLWLGLFGAFCLLFYFSGQSPAPRNTVPEEELSLQILCGEDILPISLRDYLVGAVAAEMPVSFGAEALKAQAVAIRTYVMASSRHGDIPVCTDSTCCLAWADRDTLEVRWGDDFGDNLARIEAAVDATAGEYLTYQDEPIQAVFHASSAGATEDSAALWSPRPYLVSVSTPETPDTVENLVSTLSVTPEELASVLGLNGSSPPQTWLQGVRREDSGRIKGLLLCGKAFTGSYIRNAFALGSTDFTLEWIDDGFLFTVAGKGHGVGMSQYGAKLLAAGGYTYRDILSHYYPGTTLAGP